MLLNPVHLRNINIACDPPERLDHVENERLRRGRSGSQADGAFARQPRWIELRTIPDEIAWKAFLHAYFLEAIGIGAILRTDDQNNIGNLAQCANGGLAILRCITNI